jgi:hypothetical protein
MARKREGRTRELGGQVVESLAHADPGQQLDRPLPSLGTIVLAWGESEVSRRA